ncbi:MAG: alkaline phosphatase [Candidatus Liberibacter europaeus]|uniref:histidine kinase n=1 Tax=Candidatus Liberibacter europaeus TaxID=744859 RepID=A0A2T4VYZ5_9HYPH|nr:alkaline phosphatase [Candidatus Liberibacter europaeus]PTL86988.1 MAG: alkaline phosphatase [Candidatus Liberibacter europaeus]
MITNMVTTGTEGGIDIWSIFSCRMAIFGTIVGMILAIIVPIVILIIQRNAVAKKVNETYFCLSEICYQLSKYHSLLSENNCRIVVWDGYDEKPEIIGQLSPEIDIPKKEDDFLCFENWLKLGDCIQLSHGIEKLRNTGQSFELIAETKNDYAIKIEGRVSGSCAFLRILALNGIYAELAEKTLQYQKMCNNISIFKLLLDSVESPIWQRDQRGQLIWSNNSYKKKLESIDPQQAIFENHTFFEEEVRNRMISSVKPEEKFSEIISTNEHGQRKSYKIVSVMNSFGEAAIAIDVSKEINTHDQLSHTYEILHNLTVAIAIFDKNRYLQFYNRSFVKLWGMDTTFLESNPSNDELLEFLRSANKLPEQLNWKTWKENIFSVYKSSEAHMDTWHLPNGQTLHVIVDHHPHGGTIWMFENLTVQVDLETKYNTLVKVQGETIDHLSEGVAVFGPDGRIKLSNPTFRSLWQADEEQVSPGTHIRSIAATCSKQYNKSDGWNLLASIITSFEDERKSLQGKMELLSNSVIEYSIIPLPNAQTMLTFVDVTDSVRAERALTEKNEALRKADEIKNRFVQHVSYELRSPLTNIIGFTDLLKTSKLGSLNPKQSEYIEYISTSSALLLNLVNDILDLATVDAGIMKLNYSEIIIDDLIDDVKKSIANKLQEGEITLKCCAKGNLKSIVADRQRLIQIFVKILSNAADFSPKGSVVILEYFNDDTDFVFSVTNNGSVIPSDMRGNVFNRFVSSSQNGKRRGVGLGLSIVESFIKLHGGQVSIDSSDDGLTKVTCRIPSKELEE